MSRHIDTDNSDESVDITLSLDPHNANTGTERGRAMLERSLRQYGAGRSILADRNGVIIAGNKTLEEARSLDFPTRIIDSDGTELFVIRRTDLELDHDPAARELAYLDNRTGQVDFQIDAQVLAADMENDSLNIEWMWSDDEMASLLAEHGDDEDVELTAPEVSETQADALKKKWGTLTGQLWDIGEHRMYIGDSSSLPSWQTLCGAGRDGSDLMSMSFSSPPYNMGDNARTAGYNATGPLSKYQASADSMSDEDYMKLLMSTTQNAMHACQYVFLNIQSLARNKTVLLDFLYHMREHYADTAVWCKQGAPAMPERVMSSAFEYIHIFANSRNPSRAIGTADFRGTVSNVYHGPHQTGNEYAESNAATFPLHLPSHFIESFSKPGEGVVDYFLGTGTTMIAAHQLGRYCYGIEMDPGMAAIVLERMSLLGLSPTHA